MTERMGIPGCGGGSGNCAAGEGTLPSKFECEAPGDARKCNLEVDGGVTPIDAVALGRLPCVVMAQMANTEGIGANEGDEVQLVSNLPELVEV